LSSVFVPEERCPRRSMVTRVFRYRIQIGKEIKRERGVDREVNRPEKRCPRRSMVTRVFGYRIQIGKEIKRERGLTGRSTVRKNDVPVVQW